MTNKISKLIINSLNQLNLPIIDFVIEHPADEAHGDYSSNVALILFPLQKKDHSKVYRNPRQLADSITKQLSRNLTNDIEKVEVAGSGFINFYLLETVFTHNLEEIINQKHDYGTSNLYQDKKLMVEFAHPNTHKQFHIGHSRNISLGESLCRIFEANSAKVIRTNYQGDIGLHIAKALWGVKKLGLPTTNLTPYDKASFLGEAYALGATAYQNSDETKNEIDLLNQNIYQQNDSSVQKLYATTRQWSLDYFDAIYERLYTKFDRFYFESEVAKSGIKYSQKALKAGVLEKSHGAVIFNGEPHGLDTRVFLTSKGLPTYEGKELGLAPIEFSEFGQLDKCLHVVGPEQKSFFEVTFKVEELLDAETFKGKQHHLLYEYVQLKSGKMSSRLGNVVTIRAVLDEIKQYIQKSISVNLEKPKLSPDILEMLAVGALKYSMLKVAKNKTIFFDFQESISLEGNSGPYLQYTHARCQSVIEKSAIASDKLTIQSLNHSTTNLEELSILKILYQYPEVVLKAGQEYAPHYICTYLFELSQRFNTFYNQHSILGSKKRPVGESQKHFRVALTAATAQVLCNGLYLLGIKAPNQM